MLTSLLSSGLKRGRGRVLRAMADALPSSVIFQHGSRRTRSVALSFDDGPGPMTSSYLDVLERLGVRASFFVIGMNCEARRAELDEAVRRGHDVAGHGWSHTPFTKLRRSEIEKELSMTRAVLPPGDGLRMVRPPYGRMTPRSLAASYLAGYTSAMWSFDPLDWDATSASDVVRAVDPAKVSGGDIILLHEEREATLEALPNVVERLRGEGFDIVPVSQLVPRAAP